MKTSRIIFSMLIIAGALISTTSMAQTRIIISTSDRAPHGYSYGRVPQHHACMPRTMNSHCEVHCDARHMHNRRVHSHYRNHHHGYAYKFNREGTRGKGPHKGHGKHDKNSPRRYN